MKLHKNSLNLEVAFEKIDLTIVSIDIEKYHIIRNPFEHIGVGYMSRG